MLIKDHMFMIDFWVKKFKYYKGFEEEVIRAGLLKVRWHPELIQKFFRAAREP